MDHNSKIRKGFVMAAGKGVRFRPYSKNIPKCVFPVLGEPLIVKNISLIGNAFDLDVIYVLVGHKSESVRAALKKTSGLRSRIEFVEISDVQLSKGLIAGYAAIVPYLEKDEAFISILGDEYYEGIDHPHFADAVKNNNDYSAYCGIKRYKFPDEYFNNYAVHFCKETQVIMEVQEKPTTISSDYFGLGIIAAKRRLAELAKEHLDNNSETNLIDLINILIKERPDSVYGKEFYGGYVNINTRTDVYKALKLIRQIKWPRITIDVIVPAWNEVESIEYVVKDFLPVCRHVIVMDNCSGDNTANVARQAGAVVYSQPLAGYGDAIKKGLDHSDADILVVVEADGTFRAEDLEKILVYLKNADAIIGTRTYWQYIEYGANMPFIQRMGNILFGNIITLLWWNRRSRFTDVGCTFRCMWRDSYRQISNRLIGKGPEFSPEVIIELLNTWQRVIEVPVPYHARVLGNSKFSGSFKHSAITALKMLRIILLKRWQEWLSNFQRLMCLR